MTIRELRYRLAKIPADQDDLPVLVNGYEGGYKDLQPDHIGIRPVCFNWRETNSYSGPHELMSDIDWADAEDFASTSSRGGALILDRSPRDPL
jgi:hypothetical protein